MSEIIWRSVMVCRYRLKDNIWNKRVFYTGGVFCIFLYMVEEGIRRFAGQIGGKATPWVFPFLSGDWICQMIISGYYIWIVSALCEKKEADKFIQVRAGETAWRGGSCLAVMQSAFMYVLCIIVVSALLLVPYLEFSFDWGKVWNTLAGTNAGQTYQIGMSVSPVVLHFYKPVEAVLYAAILQFLCLSWIGLLMYFVNTLAKKPIGTYMALAFVFLDVMLANTSQERFFRYSPITLAQISNYSTATMRYGIHFRYAVIFFLIGIAVFIFMSIFVHLNARGGKQ